MTAFSWVQVALCMALLVGFALPLGRYMAAVYDGRRTWLHRVFGPVERGMYRVAGVDPEREMTWRQYAIAALASQVVALIGLYAMLRMQHLLPLNPDGQGEVSPKLAFNTAVSFVTNTNWQAYGGETTLSYFSQMVGLAVQNFFSAAFGMALLVAVIRGFTRHNATTLGNYWVDLTRSLLYVLLPLALVVALLLAWQGVPQTFDGKASAAALDPTAQGADTQDIARGPVASQVAIKQLGTNGGGFYNVNSSHPLENPTPLSNLVQWLSILLIPAAVCFMFGRMVKDRRQGVALFVTMTVLFVVAVALCGAAEQAGNPALRNLDGNGADDTASEQQAGGNMEGKEVRNGIGSSVLWATATTAASNGSVNSMHDSYTPLGGLVPTTLMLLGEIIYGGVGSGLYGMLAVVILAVFIAGLMIGRTPEYLGKKIEPFEMKMAVLAIIVPAVFVLLGVAIAVMLPEALDTRTNKAINGGTAMHGLSEILYAFASASNNNGSAFAGLGVDTDFYDPALGICMLAGRYWVAIPLLAIAGSLARKKQVPVSPGTLPTHTPTFVIFLLCVIVLIGALTFLPLFALGPIAEHLALTS
ncbi:MAG: potassium-transporting ATPase subunit KdpA [Planctomycetota bacterium]